MVLESGYWKYDLCRIALELESACSRKKSVASVIRSGFLRWRFGEGYLDYQLEKWILFSAFIVRLLLESNKLSNECESVSLTLDQFCATARNSNRVNPIDRRFDLDGLYDLSKPEQKRLSIRYLVNQVMHSAVVISFSADDDGNIAGFYVVSDFDSTKKLYFCTMCEWIRMIRFVGNDDVVSLIQHWDQDRDEWVITRSSKLPPEDTFPPPVGESFASMDEP